MKRLASAFIALIGLSGLAACAPDATEERPGPTATETKSGVIFEDDFETDPIPRWDPVTKSAWRVTKTRHSQVFDQFRNVEIDQAIRAPFNRNLAKDVVVTSFQMDVDLQSTARDYEHRDLCLIFGYRDPAHLYYVHFGKVTDTNSNGIFVVNGKDRVKISSPDVPGTPWDASWHHARIVRTVADGKISVYFDDLDTPAMTVGDKTFTSGQVGIGSFDDTGRFDNVVVRRIARNSASALTN
jgi:hypothetical protein